MHVSILFVQMNAMSSGVDPLCFTCRCKLYQSLLCKCSCTAGSLYMYFLCTCTYTRSTCVVSPLQTAFFVLKCRHLDLCSRSPEWYLWSLLSVWLIIGQVVAPGPIVFVHEVDVTCSMY